MVAQTPDLVVTDRKQWPMMVIEVQNPKQFDRDYAIDFRRNVLPALAIAERVPYFLLVSQDRGYLWKANDKAGLESPPSLEFDMKPVVKHFLTRFMRGGTKRLPPDVLAYYVALWIDENINPRPGAKKPTVPAAIAKVLLEVQGGTVREEASIP